MQTPTPGLPEFEYARPTSWAEASQLLGGGEPGLAVPVMGGTDAFVQMRARSIQPRLVVDVKHLPGMRDIAYDPESGLKVGAAATMNQIAGHAEVQAHYPLLAQAARSVGYYQLRNRATIGGNLCNASPCADTSLATLVLDGVLLLRSEGGERQVPTAQFFLGPGETALRPGELMAAIQFPAPPGGAAGQYLKLGRTRLGDLAIVGVAVWGHPDPTAASGYRFRIGLGAVAPVVLRATAAEELLAGHPPGERSFALAAESAVEQAQPMSDVRASATYRSAMVRSLTLRGLRQVWETLSGA